MTRPEIFELDICTVSAYAVCWDEERKYIAFHVRRRPKGGVKKFEWEHMTIAGTEQEAEMFIAGFWAGFDSFYEYMHEEGKDDDV